MTQADRLLLYLERHEYGVTSLDIIRDLRLVNTTGRISDLRARGHRIDCSREDGYFVYRLVPPPQTTLGL